MLGTISHGYIEETPYENLSQHTPPPGSPYPAVTTVQIHYIDGFCLVIFLIFISNAYEGVLVFYLCDKYLRRKLNERLTLFHCFSPWVDGSTIVSQKERTPWRCCDRI